jgi:hypothetical protein
MAELTTNRCALCGAGIGEDEAATYKLTVPEGWSIDAVQERRAHGASMTDLANDGITLEAICSSCGFDHH